MGDHSCPSGLSFALTGNGHAYFETIMANGGSFGGFVSQLMDECLEFLLKGWELFDQSFGLAVKDSYGLNPKAH